MVRFFPKFDGDWGMTMNDTERPMTPAALGECDRNICNNHDSEIPCGCVGVCVCARAMTARLDVIKVDGLIRSNQ